MTVLPFAVPLDHAKIERIKLAERLLTEEVAHKKASFATAGGTFEFGIFPAPGGETFGVFLTRDLEGAIINADVCRFSEPHGKIWFREMQQRML
jgi:hypothetical protein